MPCPYTMGVTTLKVTSLTALALLSSSTLTTTTTILPTILALPSLPAARSSLTTLRSKTASLHTTLSRIAVGTAAVAFCLSPPWKRHPYLLWMCVPVVGIWGAEYIGWLAKEDEQEADEEQGKDMNGEVVREGVESWKKGLMSRSLYWGLGTFVGLVGIWGDGGKVRRMR